MIISHSRRFIFIKTRKTAGSSMEIALSGVCGPRDVLTPLSRREESVRASLGHRGSQNYHLPLRSYDGRDLARLVFRRRRKQYYHHVPAETVRGWVGTDVWTDYFTFCFERNPWDKTVSDYFWSGGEERFGSVERFLRSEKGSSRSDFDRYAINGVVAVDRVYRYEDLTESLDEISERIGLDSPLRLPGYRAKGSTGRAGADHRSVLSREAVELVAIKFAREISLLGYEY